MKAATATHIDGSQLVPWLAKRLGLPVPELATYVGKRWETRIRNWRKGVAAQVATVDQLLCEFDVCLGEVPDDFFCASPNGGSERGDPANRERVLRLHDLGWTRREIASIVGVNRDTVRKYVRQAAA